MPTIDTEDLAALRDQFQWSKFYLGVLVPETVHTSQINYPTIPRGEASIPFDGGAYAAGFTVANITAGMTLWVGTTAGSHDICKLRIRTHTTVPVLPVVPLPQQMLVSVVQSQSVNITIYY